MDSSPTDKEVSTQAESAAQPPKFPEDFQDAKHDPDHPIYNFNGGFSPKLTGQEFPGPTGAKK